MRILTRSRPYRNSLELVMLAVPGKWLRVSPGLDDQIDSLLGHATRIAQLSKGLLFIGCAAKEEHDDTSARQRIEHGHFLGHANRIAERQQRSEERDLGTLDDLAD